MILVADLTSSEVAAIVTAIATVVLTIVTMQYVLLTHKLTKAQTDPHVIVYAQNRPSIDLRVMIEIAIENIGKGVARDIQFSLSKSIPCRFLSKSNTGIMDEGPLINGIAALGPGQKRVLLWGTFEEIMDGT